MLETSVVKAEGMNVSCFGIGLMRKVTFCIACVSQATATGNKMSFMALNMLSRDRVAGRMYMLRHDADSLGLSGAYAKCLQMKHVYTGHKFDNCALQGKI